MTGEATTEYRYWAFITYSSKDAAWARWLHRAIETYGIPAKLVEHGHVTPAGDPVPARFQPLFRDRDELPVSALRAQVGPFSTIKWARFRLTKTTANVALKYN